MRVIKNYYCNMSSSHYDTFKCHMSKCKFKIEIYRDTFASQDRKKGSAHNCLHETTPRHTHTLMPNNCEIWVGLSLMPEITETHSNS